MGLIITFFVVLGLFGSAGYFAVGIELAAAVVARTSRQVLTESPVLVWGWMGAVFLLLTSGCLGLWVWIRQFRRLSAFLDSWERRDEHEGPLPSRVSGLTLLPVLQLIGATIYVDGSDYPLFRLVFAIGWPVILLIGTALVIDRTRKKTVPPVENEHWHMTWAVSIQTISIWAGSRISGMDRVFSPDAWTVFISPVPIGIIALFGLLVAFPTIFRYQERTESDVVFPAVVAVAGCAGLLWWRFAAQFRTLGLIFGATCVVLAGVLLVDDYIIPGG
jgi:hypothetical protein